MATFDEYVKPVRARIRAGGLPMLALMEESFIDLLHEAYNAGADAAIVRLGERPQEYRGPTHACLGPGCPGVEHK